MSPEVFCELSMGDDKSNSPETLLTPGRIIATLVLAVLIIVIGKMVFFGGGRVPVDSKARLPVVNPAAAEASTADAPPDFPIPTMDGRTIKLSDYRGKVLVIDFWATWCPPCQAETPELVKVAREDGPKGVEVVGLHIDDRGRSSPEKIRGFISQYQIPYTVGMATDDVFVAYLGREDDTIPQTLVYNRDGKLIAHFVGYDPSNPNAVDQAVNKALGSL
jgi:cytochrome c biogenesis protein CcmG/thiol:disulfide interchange protein DsbE